MLGVDVDGMDADEKRMWEELGLDVNVVGRVTHFSSLPSSDSGIDGDNGMTSAFRDSIEQASVSATKPIALFSRLAEGDPFNMLLKLHRTNNPKPLYVGFDFEGKKDEIASGEKAMTLANFRADCAPQRSRAHKMFKEAGFDFIQIHSTTTKLVVGALSAGEVVNVRARSLVMNEGESSAAPLMSEVNWTIEEFTTPAVGGQRVGLADAAGAEGVERSAVGVADAAGASYVKNDAELWIILGRPCASRFIGSLFGLYDLLHFGGTPGGGSKQISKNPLQRSVQKDRKKAF